MKGKIQMDELDTKIRKALSSENAELIGDPNEGLRHDQMVISVFKSRNFLINIGVVLISLAFMGVAIWCAVRFFGTDDMKELITFASGFLACMMAVSMMKIWFWMEMQRIMVTREIKRVELLLATLMRQDG
jgi:hypothetical protein